MSRVFIVEDYERLREMLIAFVERIDGLKVCGSSSSAESALEDLAKLSVDLVVVDASLPGMNGFELVKELGVRFPQLRCVILSERGANHYAKYAQAAGARAYVEKIRIHELPEILRQVLDDTTQFAKLA